MTRSESSMSPILANSSGGTAFPIWDHFCFRSPTKRALQARNGTTSTHGPDKHSERWRRMIGREGRRFLSIHLSSHPPNPELDREPKRRETHTSPGKTEAAQPLEWCTGGPAAQLFRARQRKERSPKLRKCSTKKLPTTQSGLMKQAAETVHPYLGVASTRSIVGGFQCCGGVSPTLIGTRAASK